MATDLEKLPYQKNFPPPWTPLILSVNLAYFGLIYSTIMAIFLSRLSLFDWETAHRISPEVHVDTVATLAEWILFWVFATDPWLGLLWGTFVGILLMLQLNADHHKHLDYYAERMIRRNRIALWGISDRRTWSVCGWVSAFVLLDLVGAYIFNVSPKTSLPALLVPAFLSYRVHKDTYDLAKEKYVAALQEGRVVNGSLSPGRVQYINLFATLILGIAIPVWFSWFLISHKNDFGVIHDAMLSIVGSTRTPEEAQALEDELENNPDNRDAHLMLAYYYEDAQIEALETDRGEALREGYYRHVLWLIEHAPEYFAVLPLYPRDGDGYEKAKQLWLQNVDRHGDDPRVLKNAADFFEDTNPELAEEILRNRQTFEPDDPKWKDQADELRLPARAAEETKNEGHDE